MLGIDLRYNRLKEKSPILNDLVLSVTLNDTRRGNGSLEITLKDIDRRFSAGMWRAYLGDSIELLIGGVSMGVFMIKQTVVRRSPACVRWCCTGKTRASGGKSSPTKGTKLAENCAKMNDKILGHVFGGAFATPKGTRLSDVMREMGKYTGVRFKSALTKARAPYRLQSGAKAVDFDMSDKDFHANYNFFDFCDDICARYGISYHADASSLTFIEPKVAPKAEVAADVVIPVIRITELQNETSVKPSKANVTDYDPRTKKASYVEAGDDSGELVSLWGYRDKESLADAVGDSLLSGKTGSVSIMPTRGIVAGSRVSIEGTIYDVIGLNYATAAGSETMTLDIRRAK